MGSKAHRNIASRDAAGPAATFIEVIRNLAKAMFDPYRPELHYMRGPGPKWHAKHDPAPAAMDAVPLLARIRVKV
jgi:hypothetical protein